MMRISSIRQDRQVTRRICTMEPLLQPAKACRLSCQIHPDPCISKAPGEVTYRDDILTYISLCIPFDKAECILWYLNQTQQGAITDNNCGVVCIACQGRQVLRVGQRASYALWHYAASLELYTTT